MSVFQPGDLVELWDGYLGLVIAAGPHHVDKGQFVTFLVPPNEHGRLIRWPLGGKAMNVMSMNVDEGWLGRRVAEGKKPRPLL